MFFEELTLPRSSRCALSRLRCNGHSTLFGTYLHRVGRAETPSCRNCCSELQELFHLVLGCPVIDPTRLPIFGHSLSILDLWSRPWSVARLLGFRGIDPMPMPRNGLGKPPPPPYCLGLKPTRAFLVSPWKNISR